MQKYNYKEGCLCYPDKTLEKNFAREELQRLDMATQASVVKAIEEILEEEKQNADELQSVSATATADEL